MAVTGSISGLAKDIFVNELDSTGVTFVSVSGWLNSNFGLLNNYLYTTISGNTGVSDSVVGLGMEEQNIYKEMYLYHYYTKQARNTLRGITNDTNGNIVSVRDGDNSISFVNKNEVSKVFKDLARDSYDKMLRLVQSYNSYQASPVQVGGLESIAQTTGRY